MEHFIFNKLREKGKENNIDIFKVDDYYGKRFIVHYFIDRELKENESIEGDNEKMSHQLREKTIELDAATSLDDVITKIKLQNTEKAPLGLTPRFIWIEQRIDEIIKAIERYSDAKQEIPKEWYFELAGLETEKNKSIQNTTYLTMNINKLSENEIKELETVLKNITLNHEFKSIC